MKSVAYFSILLAFATLALASSQSEVQPGNQASPVVESVQVIPQQQQQQQQVQPQQSGVVVNAPVVHGGSQEQNVGPVVNVVPVDHHQIHHQQHLHQQQVQHHQQQQQQQQQYYPGASYYAPAGLIQVVGEQQQQGVKPVVGQQQHQAGVVRSVEQYGQPESAALPPNYKPFGSWGLYIGGNPADGYYTNYYKQLGSSVEKQQQGQAGEQSIKPTSALSPLLKQASGISPFAGGDYYPFAYSVNELNSPAVPRHYSSGSIVQPSSVVEPSSVHHSVPVQVGVSPVQAGAQVYGSPSVSSYEAATGHYGVSPYASVESYAATKRLGSQYVQQQRETSKASVEQQQQQLPAKGYQGRVYVYPPQVGQLSAPIAFSPSAGQVVPSQQQQQVVAYPVPVASQIVGSQAGVDGAFAPYGVHAFTRYAVKPTVVSTAGEQNYHYGVSSQLPAYKQQSSSSPVVYSSPQSGSHYYQPLSYYGYPMSQLHYSQGSIVPAAVHHQAGEQVYHHSPASIVGSGSQVEASEKTETSSVSEDNKPAVNKPQQKRA